MDKRAIQTAVRGWGILQLRKFIGYMGKRILRCKGGGDSIVLEHR